MPRRIIYGVHRRSDTMGVSFTAYASIPMTLRIVYGVRQYPDDFENRLRRTPVFRCHGGIVCGVRRCPDVIDGECLRQSFSRRAVSARAALQGRTG